MTLFRGSVFCVGLVGVLVAADPGFAETVTLPALKDNTLIEGPTGSHSSGVGPNLRAGRTSQPTNGARRAVIAFDLEAMIPVGATITNVSLTLFVTQTNAGPEAMTVHRLLADWGEGGSASGGGQGAPSQPGDATWIHTHYDDRFWSAPGGDYMPMPSATAMAGGPGPSVFSEAGLVADVQAWVDHPGLNFGWIVVGNETAATTVKAFSSRENPDAATHPMLVVDYELPPIDDEDEDEDSDEDSESGRHRGRHR